MTVKARNKNVIEATPSSAVSAAGRRGARATPTGTRGTAAADRAAPAAADPPDAAPPAGPSPDLGVVDELDLRIVALLQENGRASSASIAAALGASPAGVRQRLERLLRTETVRVVAMVDPSVLGRNIVVSLRLTVEGPIGEVATRVAAVPRIAWVGTSTDLVTVLAQASVGTTEDLLDLINHEVRPIEGVRTVDTELYLRIYAVAFDFAGRDERGGPPPAPQRPWARGASQNRTVDEIDARLIDMLEVNARRSFTSMAGAVGLSVPATRQRVRRLIGDDILRVVASPNPLHFGRTCPAQLRVRTHGDSSELAAHLAATIPTATFVSEVAGAADLHVDLRCRDEAQLERVHARVAATPGVSEVRVLRYRDVVKWSGRW